MGIRISTGIGPVRVSTGLSGGRRRRHRSSSGGPPRITKTEYLEMGINETIWVLRNRPELVTNPLPQAKALADKGEYGAAAKLMQRKYLRVHGDTKASAASYMQSVRNLRQQAELADRKKQQAAAAAARAKVVAQNRAARAERHAESLVRNPNGRPVRALVVLAIGLVVTLVGGLSEPNENQLLMAAGWALMLYGVYLGCQAAARRLRQT